MKKIYVIQFRTDISEAHEQKCMGVVLKGMDIEMEFLSAVKGGLPDEVPEDAAAVIFGGSAQYYISHGDGKGSWLEETYDFIDKVIEKNIPFFGVCFGYQLLTLKYGARIVEDEAMRETGSFEVTQLDAAKNDPVFKDIPEKFIAQFGHKDTIVDIPETLIPLCKSERVACEGVRVKGKDAWGILFHAELTRDLIRERIEIFPDYAKDPEHLERVMKALSESPWASQVMINFVEYALSKSE